MWGSLLCDSCSLTCVDSAELAAVRLELEPFPLWQLQRAKDGGLPLDLETAEAIAKWVPPTEEERVAVYKRGVAAWLERTRPLKAVR